MKKVLLLFFFVFAGINFNACSEKGKIKYINLKNFNGNGKVYVDRWGFYHIYADTNENLFFLQGYIEAKSRLFYMDFFRHLSNGNLGEIVGDMVPLIEEMDRFVKEMLYGPDGKSSLEKTLDTTDPVVRKNLEAFVRGINEHIEEVKSGKAPLPEGYRMFALSTDFIKPWKITDTFAIGRFAQLALSAIRTVNWKISRALWEDNLPEEIKEDWIRWKVPTRTSILFGKQSFAMSGKNILPESVSPYSHQLIKFLNLLSSIFDSLGIRGFNGSNNWVWSGKITKDGNPILANDPHLPLLTPPVWQGFYLDSKTRGSGNLRLMGYVLSGIPGVMIGFNENIAWGVTMTGYDVADVWLQHIYMGDDGYYVRKMDGDVKIQSVVLPYRVRVDTDIWVNKAMAIYYIPGDSVLIMWDNLATDPFATPPTDGVAISFRWPGYDATHEMEAYFNLFTASTVEDFFRALNYFGVGAQNFVMIDRDNNIAYYPHALIPIRANGSRPWRLMDGYTNEGRWTGYVPDNKIPRLLNPERGYISTANNDIFGILHGERFEPPYRINPEYPFNLTSTGYYYYFSKWPGYRAERIDDMINEGKKNNTLDINYAMKMHKDVYSLMATQFVPDILEAAETRDDLLQQWSGEDEIDYKKVIQLLKNWSFHIYSGISDRFRTYSEQEKLDSAATSIFEGWLKYMKYVVYQDESEKYTVPLPETGLPCTYIKSLFFIMKDKKNSLLFDNVFTPQIETREYDILLALRKSVKMMMKLQKVSYPEELRWGKVHKLVMFSPAYQWSRLWIPTDGDDFTVNPGGELSTDSVKNYLHIDGASVRLIVEFDKNGPLRAFGVLPGSNDEDWRNSFDQFEMWMKGEYQPLIFSKNELKKYITKTYYFK